MSFKTVKPTSPHKIINPNAVFPAPFIDDVTVNGGLNYLALRADPTANVIVHCGPIPLARPGDSIDLYWIGSDGTERLVATRPITGEEIMVSLPIRVADVLLAQEGLGSLYYNFLDPFEDPFPSDDMPCLIKTTVPGNPYSAGNLPETIYVNEAMQVAAVTPLAIDQGNIAQGATVTIPAWINMSEGDVVTLNWGGYPIKQPALTAAQVGQPLEIKVTETDIRNAGNADELPVSYEVRDIVNNWSLNAAATLINVDTDLNLLDAPDVIDANEGVLNYDELTGPSPVMVETPAPVFTVGDTVTLYWKGTNAQGASIEKSYELKVAATNPSSRLRFNIPEDDVVLFVGGTTTVVSYTLTPAATGITQPSRTVMFAVIGTQANLPAPTLKNGLVDGVFEPATLPVTGAQISLPAYPGMAKDDRIFLSWKGTNSEGDPLNGSDDQTLEDSDVDKEFVFVIGKDNFLNFADATELTFSYTVIFAGTGGTRESDERLYTIKNPVAQQPPAPSVVEAPGDVLNPMNALAGATLRVKYDGMLDTDMIGINWNDDGSFPNKPGNKTLGYVDFPIDVARVAPTIGKTITAFYSVGRNGGYDMSLNLPLQVLEFQNPAIELPTPVITEVVASVLDLAVFSGDAHITVEPWPLIAVGQTVWLQLVGKKEDGSEHIITLSSAQPVTPPETTAGLSIAVPRAELELLAIDSDFTVECRVDFAGGAEQSAAVLFNPLALSITKKWPTRFENFDLLTPQVLNPEVPLILKDMTINAGSGVSIAAIGSGDPPASGNVLSLGPGSSVIFTFHQTARNITFLIFDYSKISSVVTIYDKDGYMLGNQFTPPFIENSNGVWMSVTIPAGKSVKTMVFKDGGGDSWIELIYLDESF